MHPFNLMLQSQCFRSTQTIQACPIPFYACNNTSKLIYNPNAKKLVTNTTRPLVLKYLPCPSMKNSSLLRVRLNAATRIIKNPNTVYNTKLSTPARQGGVRAVCLLGDVKAPQVCGRTSNGIELFLKDFKNDQSKGELTETRSPIRSLKSPLTSPTS